MRTFAGTFAGTFAVYAWRLVRCLACAVGLTAMLGGCALTQPPSAQAPPPEPAGPAAAASYSGRLSLSIEPSGNFQAQFDLQGDARQGQLALSGPLGQTLALLEWAPGEAALVQGQQRRAYASPQALIAQVTGAPLPWEAFFAWLHGDAASAAGWQVDLSRHAEGRISARRDEPAPRVELRLQLSR